MPQHLAFDDDRRRLIKAKCHSGRCHFGLRRASLASRCACPLSPPSLFSPRSLWNLIILAEEAERERGGGTFLIGGILALKINNTQSLGGKPVVQMFKRRDTCNALFSLQHIRTAESCSLKKHERLRVRKIALLSFGISHCVRFICIFIRVAIPLR